MAEKPEDNRDVFEKALDDASPALAAGGMLTGAIGGLALASIGARKAFKKLKNNQKLNAADIAALQRADRRALPASLVGSVAGGGGTVAGLEGYVKPELKKRRR